MTINRWPGRCQHFETAGMPKWTWRRNRATGGRLFRRGGARRDSGAAALAVISQSDGDRLRAQAVKPVGGEPVEPGRCGQPVTERP